MIARLGGIAFLALLCVLVAGCAGGRKSRVTKENFDKIKNDMSQDDVEDVLGKGTPVGDGSGAAAAVGVDINAGARPSSVEEYVWQDGDKSINVSFRKDKVVGKRHTGL